MNKLHVKVGDTVMLMVGDKKGDRGKTGKVLTVSPKEGKVIVEGINMVSKHAKPSPKHPQGGIIKQEAGIHVSNLQIVDPSKGGPTRIGHKFVGDKKIRYAKKSGEEIK